MAKFSKKMPDLLASVPESVLTPEALPGAPSFEAELDKPAVDFRAAVEAIFEAARAARELEQDNRPVPAPGADGGIVVEAGPAGAKPAAEQVLEEAKQHMVRSEWMEALALLAKLLATDPRHGEARYLRAYCQAALNEPKEALRELAWLDVTAASKALAEQAMALRVHVRTILLLGALYELVMSTDAATSKGIRELKQLIELDPECGQFHFLLCALYVKEKRFKEALRALDAAEQFADAAAHEALGQARRQILRQHLVELLQPAVEQFKRERFAAARKALAAVPESYRSLPLFARFDRHIATFERGLLGIFHRKVSNWRQSVPDSGQREELYQLLVGTELDQAKQAIAEKKFPEAVQSMRSALTYAPDFPQAHFLLALALHNDLGQQIGTRRPPPPIETAIAGFEEALQHARQSTTDDQITLARPLVDAIEDILAKLGEQKLVNDLLASFRELAERLKPGIRSVEDHQWACRKVKELRERIQRESPQVRSADAVKSLKELEKACAHSASQLESMKGAIREAETVKARYEEFKQCMEILKAFHGQLPPQVFYQTRQDLQNLLEKVNKDIARAATSEARRALQELQAAIATTLSHFVG